MDIGQYLNSLPKDTLHHYFPNPGNGGDCLIAHAAFQLFKEHKVNYRILDIFDSSGQFDLTNKTLIYSGGGNLVNNNNSYARKIIQRYHCLVKKLIILPHTINTHEDLLKDLGSNVDIICREEVSYDHVKKYASKANVMLMDDLAFCLNAEDILNRKTTSFLESLCLKIFYKITKDNRRYTIPEPRKILENNKLSIQQYFQNFFVQNNWYSCDSNILNCFRTDGEKSNISVPSNNLDLSVLFAYGTFNEQVASEGCCRLFNFMNKFNEIRTNRLHLGIAGVLLGKEVKFYPNNYYKCEAVYQFSMKNRFPNIQWMG